MRHQILRHVTVTLAVASFLAGCAVDDPSDPELDDEVDSKADGTTTAAVVIGNQDTYLKKRIVDANGNPVQAADLPTNEKCFIRAHTRVELQQPGALDGVHVRVNTRVLLPQCPFSQGYLYIPHIESATFRLSGSCTGAISASACALLGTIAYAEGTGNRYDYTFGYQTFSSFRDHPRRIVCSGGYCSDAAGRYQFLSTTWDAVRSGLPDFGPASQDTAALRLIRNRGVTNVDGIDTYGEFTSAIYALDREWASLPGSPYGQPTRSMASLWTEFRRLRGI